MVSIVVHVASECCAHVSCVPWCAMSGRYVHSVHAGKDFTCVVLDNDGIKCFGGRGLG